MAGKSAGFAIGIGINDAASAGLDALNKRIAALSAPAERFNKGLAKFGEVTGINRAAEGMQTLADRTLGAARAVERLAGPMVGITSAASLGGMAALSRQWAEAGNSISKTANLLNTPVDRLSALRGAARLAGSSADAMDSSLKGLSETLHAAFYNRDATAQMNLKALGIDWRDASGNITTVDAALGKLADKVSTYKDKATAGRALSVLGVDKDLLPLLEKGQAGLDEFMRRARETGGVMTGEMAANAKKMNSSWSELGLAIEGVGNRIVDSWSGTATKVLDTTSHWIERNKDLADSYGKDATAVVGAVAALSAIKPAVWILRALGLLGPAELLAVTGGIGYLANQLPPAVTHDDTRTIFTPGGITLPFAPLGSPFNPAPSSDDYQPPWYQRAWHWITGPRNAGGGPPHAGTMQAGVAQRTHDFWRSRGYTENQVAGILAAGPGAESGFNPSIVGDQGTSYGLYQHHNERWAAMHQRYHTQYPSEQQQNEYAAWEISPEGPLSAVGAALHGATTPQQSALVWTGGFEKPADPAEGMRRGSNAAAYAGLYDRTPGAPGAAGHVQVDVHLHGAPQGTTATVVGSGAVSASPPRIEHSMPMAGSPWS